MAVRYVGPGGSDANSGLTYALRKLTIDGCENTPVTAGDIIHVAPGVYRELLTCDVSGTAGNAIEYRADVSGANTDGIGGLVRITGSDNDTTATRGSCITATSKNYRTFTGFTFDTTTGFLVSLITACGNWIVQDCHFSNQGANATTFSIAGTGTTNTVRRCLFRSTRSNALLFTHSSVVDNAAHLVENCIFQPAASTAVRSERVGGITVKHCVFDGGGNGVRVSIALTTGQTTTVRNCIFTSVSTAAMQAVTAPGTNEEITEDYNAFWGNIADRTNVSTGANSVAYPPLYNPVLLLSGFALPQLPFMGLSEWSPVRAIAGTSMSSEDMLGITRPATDSKKSWGALQHAKLSRETTTVRTGAASLKLADAGSHQIEVEVSNVSTIFSCYVQWEADYAGTKPQMIIRQAGQSDTTVTATGSSGTWELLTTTLTPAALPKKVYVEFRSNNTAAATNFDVFVDDFRAVPA